MRSGFVVTIKEALKPFTENARNRAKAHASADTWLPWGQLTIRRAERLLCP